MNELLVMAVWTCGRQHFITLQELDNQYKTVMRMTWPITYCEGAEMAQWATLKARQCDGFTALTVDGWNIYMPIESVSQGVSGHAPIHDCRRIDPSYQQEYRDLAQTGGYVSYSTLG